MKPYVITNCYWISLPTKEDFFFSFPYAFYFVYLSQKSYKYIAIYTHSSSLKGKVMGWVIQTQQSRPSMAQRKLLKNNRGQLKQWNGKKEIKSLAVKFWHRLIMARLLYHNVAALGKVTKWQFIRQVLDLPEEQRPVISMDFSGPHLLL